MTNEERKWSTGKEKEKGKRKNEEGKERRKIESRA